MRLQDKDSCLKNTDCPDCIIAEDILNIQGLKTTQVISHQHYIFYSGKQVSLLHTATQSVS